MASLHTESFRERATRRLAGLLLANPHFDRGAMALLSRAFFPLSRLWAAAELADGEPEKFHAGVPMEGRLEDNDRLRAALHRFERARAAHLAITHRWSEIFYAPRPASLEVRYATEAARRRLAHAYNAERRAFLFLLRRRVPRIALATATPEEAERAMPQAARGASLFAPPDPMPSVEVSNTVPGAVGTDCWVRFASPSESLSDTVYARVHTPNGIANPPTLILGHGICVEFDHWDGLIDETNALVRRGIRVIRPEAPWHGRRRKPGTFGGEPIVATFPLGPLHAFSGALREWSVLADWARSTSAGPLLMGGTSLGALMAQLAADKARDWPERLRPQALLLITHCGRMEDAILDSAFSRLWGSAADAARKGWTSALIEQWMNVLDPGPVLTVAPQRIVSVLGRRDAITPYPSGERIVRDWGVPPENLFTLDRGHFSVPMTLLRDERAIERFAAIVARL